MHEEILDQNFEHILAGSLCYKSWHVIVLIISTIASFLSQIIEIMLACEQSYFSVCSNTYLFVILRILVIFFASSLPC
jgi:hypothetical protein